MAHVEDRRWSTPKGSTVKVRTDYKGKVPYRVRYRTADGQPRSQSFEKKADATKFEASVEVAKFRGELVDPRAGRLTFRAVADEWLGTVSHLKPKTVAGYESILSKHLLPEFGDIPVNAIDTAEVKRFVSLKSRTSGHQTVKNTLNVLRGVLGTAVDSRRIAVNPAIGVKLDKAKARRARSEQAAKRHYLTPEQINDLAGAMGSDEYRLFVLFAAYAGARAGEIAGLRVSDLDLGDTPVVHIRRAVEEVHGALVLGATKNGEPRTVRLPRFLVAELRLHLARTGRRRGAWLFQSPEGGQLRHSNFYRRSYQPAAEASDMPEGLRFHDLRHSCAAMLIASGAHPKAIQVMLGHSSIDVTMDTYGGLFDAVVDRLAEALDNAYSDARANIPRPGRVLGLA
jgi:integrase